MTIDCLKPGQSALIKEIEGSGTLRHHLLDMGLTPGTRITLQKIAPMGDPIQFEVRGYELTLRRAEAEKIILFDESSAEEQALKRKLNRRTSSKKQQYNDLPHPGVGELGASRQERLLHNTVAKSGPLTFALVGNQNCGKTTLFNQLTGSNQHVGNFPGVTVDRKDGTLRNHPEATVTDLPGVYSLSPYSNEEIVTRDFLLETKPDGIINIIDGTNIERNLYLTMQLMELDIPMVLALNMMDEVEANGGTIRINELESELGIPVVPISAVKNEGVEELVQHALHVARYNEAPERIDFCPANQDDNSLGAVHRCIHATAHIVEPYAKQAAIPNRFAATKIVEGDSLILAKLALPKEILLNIRELTTTMEKEAKMDQEAALANMRFDFLENLCDRVVVRPHESKEHARSRKIDKLLTGKYTAIPCFISIMALVFTLTFGVIGAALQELFEQGIDIAVSAIDTGLQALEVNPVVCSLVVDGICAGVGTVLSFLPIIVTLFFFLSILEDSGYMARVAFVMDRLMRKIGLSGRSIVPLLIGFGCSVPAIMSTRTLSSERDRKMTILLTPFMSCSAKLPIYAMMVGAFFPVEYRALVMLGLYLFGIVCGILFALILNATRFRGEPVPFVMELPNYRLPGLKNMGQLVWEKAKGFIQKAFTVIFIASIIIWILQTFDLHLNIAESPDTSLLALLGGAVAPLFVPLGFGDWRVSTALITGFMAKETVVSTLALLLGGNLAALSSLFTPFTALVFLVFVLLYTPCVAAIATVRRELGTCNAILTVITQCGIAWIAAFIVRCTGLLFGLA